VTGGQTSLGLVELNEPAPSAGVTIRLSSSDPAIVVPATVKVEPGAVDASFPVETTPVADSTTVTVSARTSATASPQTATVTVRPPSISFISCTPQTVPAGTQTTCKVQLDGPVASPTLGAERDQRVLERGKDPSGNDSRSITIVLASSNAAVATAPASVSIGPGERSRSFTVNTMPLAQSASSLISASYGGVTKGTNVHVTPVALQYLACGNASTAECEYTAWHGGEFKGYVKLTAPAPEGGLMVKLSDDPNLLEFWDFPPEGGSLRETDRTWIRGGETSGDFRILARTVARTAPVDTRVTISASTPLSSDTRAAVITLRAVHLQYVACGAWTSTTTECEHLPKFEGNDWSAIGGNVRLTGQARENLVVKLLDSPNLVRFWHRPPGENHDVETDNVVVRKGSTDASFRIRPRAVAVDTRVTISAYGPSAGPTRTAQLIIKAPTVRSLRFESYPLSGVAVGGQKVRLFLSLTGGAPAGGLPVNIKYSGTTDITGPEVVKIPEAAKDKPFEATVGPCTALPVCEVVATAGTVSAKLVVNP
jgi:hypothetical protein